MKQKKKVTDKQVTDVINKNDTSENVAQQTGYSKKTVENKVKKGKLNLGFIPDTGDSQPPPIDNTTQQVGQQGQTQIIIDYEATARGFVQFIDMILWFVAKISQEQLEYEKLTPSEIEACTNALKTETKALEILASQGWAMHAIVLFQLVGVFSTKIKFSKKKKEKDAKKKAMKKANEEARGDSDTKEVIKKQKLASVTNLPKEEKPQPIKINEKVIPLKSPYVPKGQAKEVSTEVLIDEEPFLETDDIGNIDGSSGELIEETKVHDEKYGNPPEKGKGLEK